MNIICLLPGRCDTDNFGGVSDSGGTYDLPKLKGNDQTPRGCGDSGSSGGDLCSERISSSLIQESYEIDIKR